MFPGPIFHRTLAITPRRPRLYLLRTIYAASLVMLIATSWLVLTGAQLIRGVGDMARFGSMLFQIIAPLQLALVTFLAAMTAASSVALEKDRRTLILLLMTRMTNSELVVGKLLASLLNVLVMVATALPIFVLCTLFGGISWDQIVRVFGVTLTTALLSGSLGGLIAFWREKTFQTLALTALTLCFWLGIWETFAAGVWGETVLGISAQTLAIGFSPIRAIFAASRPFLAADPQLGSLGNGVCLYLVTSLTGTVLLCLISVLRVRVWNPSREVRSRRMSESESESIWITETAPPREAASPSLVSGTLSGADEISVEKRQAEAVAVARQGHVDSQLRSRTATNSSRSVWDNPVLWRELRTWAYGRKIIFIRVAYLLLVGLASAGLYASLTDSPALASADASVVPSVARPLAPLFLVSLVIINALAVTSVTTERDGQSLDLLLATDLSPHEFVFGKLGGVYSVSGLMVGCPLVFALALWAIGEMNLENTIYTVTGWIVMSFFVATLGIHCGMRYANSRTAIGVSLGTVFFLFLGVITCMLMMISFNRSFEIQLTPFLAFIFGGGVGLFVALSANQPSKAIAAASILAPFATFFAITSFLMEKNLSVFLVTTFTYGFTTAAMLVPALSEFEFAMGQGNSDE